jgi:hypothetical protein
MPIEECVNMLILVGALARADGDIHYVRKHWAGWRWAPSCANCVRQIGKDSPRAD